MMAERARIVRQILEQDLKTHLIHSFDWGYLTVSVLMELAVSVWSRSSAGKRKDVQPISQQAKKHIMTT